MATSNPAPATSFIYGMPQGQGEACQRSSYLTHIKRTAVIQMIGGCVLVALGIVAIILRAYWSFYATAIWSGLVVYGLNGVIGILAASKGNKCLINTYLGMSVLGCLMGYALFEMHIHAAILEYYSVWWNHYYDYYGYPGCQPGGYYTWIPNCSKSQAARQTFDALICITGFFLFIVCMISASFGCCAACKCCGPCCKKCCCNGGGCSQCCTATPQPVTAIFQPQGAPVSTVGQHQGHQQGQQQVHHQAGMYIVQQAPPPTMQYQQVAMPPPGSTNQGQTSYIVMPPAANQGPPQSGPGMQPHPSHLVAPPQSGPGVQPHPSHLVAPPQSGPGMQPHPSHLVAPPSYYVAGTGNAPYPQVEQPQQDHDVIKT